MRIIFVKDHIVDDENNFVVLAGRTGDLIDSDIGLVSLDDLNTFESIDGESERMMKNRVLGYVSGVHVQFFIPLREDSRYY